MSRIAKAPILIPNSVQVDIQEDRFKLKGPKGEVSNHFHNSVKIKSDDNGTLNFEPLSLTDPNGWAHAGTARALIHNALKGVTEGFEVTLELIGVGYRAQLQGKALQLSLGFSHPVHFPLPEEVSAELPNNTTIILKGADLQKVTQVAAVIRAIRPPEPYKGKGIRRKKLED